MMSLLCNRSTVVFDVMICLAVMSTHLPIDISTLADRTCMVNRYQWLVTQINCCQSSLLSSSKHIAKFWTLITTVTIFLTAVAYLLFNSNWSYNKTSILPCVQHIDFTVMPFVVILSNNIGGIGNLAFKSYIWKPMWQCNLCSRQNYQYRTAIPSICRVMARSFV